MLQVIKELKLEEKVEKFTSKSPEDLKEMSADRNEYRKEIRQHVEDSLPKTVSSAQKTEVTKQLQKHVQHRVHKRYGIKEEQKIVDESKKDPKKAILQNNIYLKRSLKTVLPILIPTVVTKPVVSLTDQMEAERIEQEKNYPNYYLVGKIDGFSNGTLIEIKNRVNRLFNTIPFYERIQILCYLYLLQEEHPLQQGTLVEQVRLRNNKHVQKRETIVQWDADYWNNTMLRHAVYFFDNFGKFQKDYDKCTYYLGLENENKQLGFLKEIFPDLPGVQMASLTDKEPKTVSTVPSKVLITKKINPIVLTQNPSSKVTSLPGEIMQE